MVEINVTEKNAVSRENCYKFRISVYKNKKCIMCYINVDKLR